MITCRNGHVSGRACSSAGGGRLGEWSSNRGAPTQRWNESHGVAQDGFWSYPTADRHGSPLRLGFALRTLPDRGASRALGTATAIGWLRTSGPRAVSSPDGPVTGERFRAYGADTLVQSLTRRHTHPGQPRRSQGRGRTRGHRGSRSLAPVLPPYSPEFNPIGCTCAKPEALLRRAAAHTDGDLCETVHNVFASRRRNAATTSRLPPPRIMLVLPADRALQFRAPTALRCR